MYNDFTYHILLILYYQRERERDVLYSSPCAKEYPGENMTKYFELNDNKVKKDLQEQGRVNLQHQN